MENETGVENVAKPDDGAKPVGAGAKIYKILSVALNVVLYIFLALSIFLLVVSIVSKNNSDGAVNLFGYEMRIVVSSSMEKSEYSPDVSKYKIKDIKIKSVVFVERVPDDSEKAKEWYSKLEVGDVLTFKYVIGSSQETITHRIIEITPTASGYIISLQGDNRGESATVSTQTIYTSPDDYPTENETYNHVIGKVVGNSTALGYVLYSLKQPIGTALIIIVPCSIIIIWQVIRIFAVINEDRKNKATKESEDKERELEELKRKIAELEGNTQNSDGGNGDVG